LENKKRLARFEQERGETIVSCPTLYSRSPLTLQKHQKRAAALTRLRAADRNVVQLEEILPRLDREARAIAMTSRPAV
jgi:ABC-type sulfate/molybdate transport systems ATPase subunit